MEAKDKNNDTNSLVESLVTHAKKVSGTYLKVSDLESKIASFEMGDGL